MKRSPDKRSARRRRLLFLALFFLAAAPGWALSPALRWRTLETKRFSLHYHQGEEEAARRAADVAEHALPVIETDLGWTVHGKIQLVLLDDYDIANGFATPFPYNLVYIFLPAPEAGGSLADYDDWLRLVITHELTHIVHLDMAIGAPRVVRAIFGRTPMGFTSLLPTTFPNLSQPVWLIEGLGVFNETKFTSAGRGRGKFFDMMLRSAVVDGRVSTLGQLSDWQTTWPGGFIRYLYGDSLYEYMAAHIRNDATRRLAQSNARNMYPQFHINSAPAASFGLDYQMIYERWRRHLNEQVKQELTEIQKKPVTPSAPLTARGFQVGNAAVSPDGQRIAYTDENRHAFPSVRVMKRDGSHDEEVALGFIQSAPSWSPDGSALVFSLLDYYHTHSLKADLYIYRFADRRLTRLTTARRATDPAWSPDGTQLAFVQYQPGRQNLVLFDLATHHERTVISGAPEEQFGHPRWSPDGRRLVFAHWQDGAWDIQLLTLDSGRVENVTSDRAIDAAPAWEHDGRAITFSSDRSGVFNIFSYSIVDKKLRQVTNVVGGAFEPAAASSSTLVFSNYTSRGFDLHATNTTSATPAAPYKDAHPARPTREPAAEISAEHRYNALPTLWPRFWIPNFHGGIVLAGQDVLAKHYYFLSNYSRADFEATYINQQLFPFIELNKWRLEEHTGYTKSTPLWVPSGEGSQGESVAIQFPIRRMLFSHLVTIGYLKNSINTGRAQQNELHVPPAPMTDIRGVEARYAFNNSIVYGFSVAPEDGRQIAVNTFYQGAATGKDVSLRVLEGKWNEFLPGVRRHHVLNIGVGGGKSNQPAFDSYQDRLWALTDIRQGLRSGFAKSPHGQNATAPAPPNVNMLPPIQKQDDGSFSETANAQIAYAFPIVTIEQAPGTGFVFLDRIRGQVYSYGEKFWDSSSTQSDGPRRLFVGGELMSDWGLSYFLPLAIGVDAQKQVDDGSRWKLSGRIDIVTHF